MQTNQEENCYISTVETGKCFELKYKIYRLYLILSEKRSCIMTGNKNSSLHFANTIKFTLFADLHYKKGMYISSVADLQEILDRAKQNNVDFVIHLGDLCNDYRRSPELLNTYLYNCHGLPVYGIYGNHELESRENDMATVTPMLCNREVTWGTPDGTIGDGSIGYYYFDHSSFRVICLDTNYSQNPENLEWEHNRTASWGAPAENLKKDSLAPRQLVWLEHILQDTAERGLHCLLFSHTGFSGIWYSSPDAVAVREMIRCVNEKRKGTVLMSVSGHLHTDHQAVVDGVVHFDVNTVRNGLWLAEAREHYGGLSYPFVNYDANGNETERCDRPLSELRMAAQTWFFDRPLSAVVTVSGDGSVTIEGSAAEWYGGVVPDARYEVNARISDGRYGL